MAAGIGVGQREGKGMAKASLLENCTYIAFTSSVQKTMCTTKQTKNELLPQLPKGKKTKAHKRKRVVVGHTVQELKHGSHQ